MSHDHIPPSEDEKQVLNWANEAVKEGTAFLTSQPGYDKIETSMDYIMGDFSGKAKPSVLSNVRSNRFGKYANDLAASLTDIKPFWEYRTHNKRFDQQAILGNKLAQAWWMNRHIDLKFSECIKYGLVAATGYAHLVYNEDTKDLDMIAEDPRDVIPIRPSSLYSIQDCLGVLIRRERTVNYLKAKYPDKKDRIKADREAPLRTTRQQTKFGKLMRTLGLDQSPFAAYLESSLGGKAANTLGIPATDFYTLYVKDERRNTKDDLGEKFTGGIVYMGPWRRDKNGEYLPEANWSYKVEQGEKLYPNKRLITFTKDVIFYDGPSHYWHGYFPIIKITLDPWPWTWLGKAPMWDLIPLQESLDSHLQIVEDHNEKFARPDVIADKNSVSRSTMNRLDTRRAGAKFRTNPAAGKGVTLEYPPPLEQSIQGMIDFLIKEMSELSGASDAAQFAKLGQIPSAETVEKMLEAMTPAIRMRSRNIEATLRQFAHITLSNFFQFYTTAQRIAILGPQGMTFEDFDFDPGTLIPDYIEEKDFEGATGFAPNMEARQRGPGERSKRAQSFLRFFKFYIAPGSLLAASEITRKMMYLQLARAGWVDIWTLLDVLGIPGVGEAPAGTIPERLAMQAEQGLGMDVNPAGRKSSGQRAPRTVIKES